jgi:hypothetical protein
MFRKLLITTATLLALMAPASAAIIYQPGLSAPVPSPTVPQGIQAHWADFGEWVQLASRASLTDAIHFAARVQKHVPNTVVFSSDRGWFAVAVGPYADGTGESALRQLLNSGVPGDSFVTVGEHYVSLLWGISPIPTGPMS